VQQSLIDDHDQWPKRGFQWVLRENGAGEGILSGTYTFARISV
jgi:hypothetical protein